MRTVISGGATDDSLSARRWQTRTRIGLEETADGIWDVCFGFHALGPV